MAGHNKRKKGVEIISMNKDKCFPHDDDSNGDDDEDDVDDDDGDDEDEIILMDKEQYLCLRDVLLQHHPVKGKVQKKRKKKTNKFEFVCMYVSRK